jgi:organic radical activating enzyme
VRSETLQNYGRHIAVSVTNSCPIQCAHCISGSSPHTQKGHAGLEAMLARWLELSPEVEHVTLTGGEPFHDLARLAEFVSICAARSIRSGVITSAYWPRTKGLRPQHSRGCPGSPP